MVYHIKRGNSPNPLDWRYRANEIQSWSIFPDNAAENIGTMLRYLSRFGDEPSAVFTDDLGQPGTYAEVRRLPNGKTTVRLNAGEREKDLNSWEFWSHQEQYQFFRDRTTEEVNSQALTKDLHDALRLYKEQADPDTKKEFAETLAAKINDEAVTAILKQREGDGVKVFFNG